MKKVMSLVVLIMYTFMYAQSININSGWQLKGTETGFSNMEVFNKSCINVVWKYNEKKGSWSAYSNNTSIKNQLNNSSIDVLDEIGQNDGFWVNGLSECLIGIDTEQVSNIT